MVRAWTPTVPHGWSTSSEVVVDEAATAAVFRGIAIAREHVYVTDFHNARVLVYDDHWRPVRRAGAFVDTSIPEWYAPFGVQALGDRVFVTYVWRAPVNGNDAPTGGYVDEFDLDGQLVARVARKGSLNAPWGLALAPRSFGRFGGDLLVGNFGDGHINAFRRDGGGWRHDGTLAGRNGKPLEVNGLWALAFGNDGAAGPSDTLFFSSGPHDWRGVTELGVHGLFGSISAGLGRPARSPRWTKVVTPRVEGGSPCGSWRLTPRRSERCRRRSPAEGAGAAAGVVPRPHQSVGR